MLLLIYYSKAQIYIVLLKLRPNNFDPNYLFLRYGEFINLLIPTKGNTITYRAADYLIDI